MTSPEDQLKSVEAALRECEEEAMRLEAKIAGLRAERDSWLRLISKSKHEASVSPVIADLKKLTRGDAIVAVLQQAGEPLHLEEIMKALLAAGRTAKYDGVSVDLTGLVKGGRVERVGRGLYALP